MTTGPAPDCLSCLHLREGDDDAYGEPTCDAYPKAIPKAIFWEAQPHRVPRRGDNGIVFAQDSQKPPVDPLPR